MKDLAQSTFTPWALACAVLAGVSGYALAQEAARDSLAGEASARARVRAVTPERYNVRWGAAGLTLSAGFRTEFVDNVFLTHADERVDFILVPEIDAGLFMPVGQLNTLILDLGISYYHYLNNSELNSGTPLINPDSEVVLNIYSGDFAFQVTGAFSYQETPFHEYGGEFFNVYDTGRFARYRGRLGAGMTWDLQDLVVGASYYHEGLISNGSTYDYINRASDLFDVRPMLDVSPSVTVGLEATTGLHRFENLPSQDHWRATLGPALESALTRFVTAKLGGGYTRIQYTSSEANDLDLDDIDTYYAYAGIEHEVNRFVSHELRAGHDNLVGINAPNLKDTYVTYSLSWIANERVRVIPYAGYHMYEESFGEDRAGLYFEQFAFVNAGIRLEYEFAPRWRLTPRYDYRWKDSDVETFSYAQNRAAFTVTYLF